MLLISNVYVISELLSQMDHVCMCMCVCVCYALYVWYNMGWNSTHFADYITHTVCVVSVKSVNLTPCSCFPHIHTYTHTYSVSCIHNMPYLTYTCIALAVGFADGQCRLGSD